MSQGFVLGKRQVGLFTIKAGLVLSVVKAWVRL
jgi:hypothetical protein